MEISFSNEEFFWLILAVSFFTLFMSSGFALLYFFYHKTLTDGLLKAKKLELKRKSDLLNSQIKGQDIEREKIARAIHDEISSKLAVLQISVEHILSLSKGNHQEESDLIGETISKLIDSTENISHGLLPPDLEHAGLAIAVEELVNILSLSHKIKIDFLQYVDSEYQRNLEVELGVYRIIHELIHNTLKYAYATKIKLEIQVTRLTIELRYSDNGRGFNVEEASANGLGIRSILSRADFLNADYSIDSEEGKGMQFNLKTKI